MVISREILFKGQRKSDRAWIFGNLLRTDDGIFIIQNRVPYHLLSKYEVLEDTVCEYTGLTDKNGRKIFENDLIGCDMNRVELLNGEWCINGDRPLFFFRDMEVVRNFFDKGDGAE